MVDVRAFGTVSDGFNGLWATGSRTNCWIVGPEPLLNWVKLLD